MRERGPSREPTKLKMLKGERKDRMPPAEVQPPRRERAPACPVELGPSARKVWRRLAPQLFQQELLTDWDRESFAAYCIAAGNLLDASALISKPEADGGGLVVKSQRDTRVKHQALQTLRESSVEMRAWSKHFGLTPGARASLDVQTPAGRDGHESDRLLSG